MIQVILQNSVTTAHVPDHDRLTQWVNAAVIHSKQSIALSQRTITIRIVNREEGAKLNENFRQKNGATNVLAFPDEGCGAIKPDSLGDLAICAEIVIEEARQQHKTPQAHWAHLVIHGVLHLLGYDHLEKQQADIMEQLEVETLAALNFPNPYLV